MRRPTHQQTTQRLQHLVATAYGYVRPAAYYGFIPFVLYVGMNGDAAPRSVRVFNLSINKGRPYDDDGHPI